MNAEQGTSQRPLCSATPLASPCPHSPTYSSPTSLRLLTLQLGGGAEPGKRNLRSALRRGQSRKLLPIELEARIAEAKQLALDSRRSSGIIEGRPSLHYMGSSLEPTSPKVGYVRHTLPLPHIPSAVNARAVLVLLLYT
jgi:hypothetical protein